MHYFSQKKFTYNGIAQSNRNPVIYQDIGGDGLKTANNPNKAEYIIPIANDPTNAIGDFL